jgi:hypothetical protein
MTTPGIARYRRTFLAPVWIGLVWTLLVLALLLGALRWTTTPTLVVLVNITSPDPAADAGAMQRLAARLGPGGQFDALLAERGAIDGIAAALGAPAAERFGVDAGETGAIARRLRWRLRGSTVLVALPPAATRGLLEELVGDALPAAPAGTAGSDRYWVVTLSGFGPPAGVELRD